MQIFRYRFFACLKIFFLILCGVFFIDIFIQPLRASDEVRAKVLYLKVLSSDANKVFYVGQEVNVQYEMQLFADAKFLSYNFINAKNTKPQNTLEWQEVEDGRFEANVNFLITGAPAKIPDLQVQVGSSDYIENQLLQGQGVEVINLYGNNKYIGVMGTNFNILRSSVESLNDFANILIIEFQVKSKSIKNMRIAGYKDQNIEEIELDNLSVEKDIESNQDEKTRLGIFTISLPKETKEFMFDVFNPKTEAFESFSIKTQVDKSPVVHDDIKPKAGFSLFKLVFFISLVVIFIALFIWSKKKIYLVFAIICTFCIASLFFIKSEEAKIRRGAPITLLPLEDSTIIKIVDSDVSVPILGIHKHKLNGQKITFYKIMINNSQVGWIRSEYVSNKGKN